MFRRRFSSCGTSYTFQTPSVVYRLKTWPRILDGLHACLICVAMYWYCVTNFANIFAIEKPVWYVCLALLCVQKLISNSSGLYR